MVKNDADILNECGYLKNDILCLCEVCKNILMEQNEKYLDYFEYEEESIIRRFLQIYWNNILLYCLKVLDMKDHW